MLILFIFLLCYLIQVKYRRIDCDSTMQKTNPQIKRNITNINFLEGINNKNIYARFFTPIILIRKAVFVTIIIIYVYEHRYICCSLLLGHCSFLIIVIILRPFKKTTENLKLIFNEVMITVIMAFSGVFLERDMNNETALTLGWVWIGLCTFTIVVNWVFLLIPMISGVTKMLKTSVEVNQDQEKKIEGMKNLDGNGTEQSTAINKLTFQRKMKEKEVVDISESNDRIFTGKNNPEEGIYETKESNRNSNIPGLMEEIKVSSTKTIAQMFSMTKIIKNPIKTDFGNKEAGDNGLFGYADEKPKPFGAVLDEENSYSPFKILRERKGTGDNLTLDKINSSDSKNSTINYHEKSENKTEEKFEKIVKKVGQLDSSVKSGQPLFSEFSNDSLEKEMESHDFKRR